MGSRDNWLWLQKQMNGLRYFVRILVNGSLALWVGEDCRMALMPEAIFLVNRY